MPRNKILFVNDDADFIKALSPILKARNYSVSAASGGEEGLEKARRERPDLILLETKMPDMDGFAVCSRLRADRNTKGIPVIMVSDNGGSESVMKARASGANDYIVKPVNLVTLLSKLRKFLVR
jgi:two-component system cell cycle response regulator